VIELALVLPILLIVVLGIIDFGRAVNYWNDENHVAEVAARFAAVGQLPTTAQDPTCGGLATLSAYIQCQTGQDSPELKSGCTQVNGSCNGVQGALGICVDMPAAPVPGDSVTVKLTAPYKWLPLPKVLGGSTSLTTVNLTGTATMRIENPPATPSNFYTQNTAC
jgi:hypothetical protein